MKDENVIMGEIEQAIAQVDDTLTLDTCNFIHDTNKRSLEVHFTAKAQNGETVAVSTSFG